MPSNTSYNEKTQPTRTVSWAPPPPKRPRWKFCLGALLIPALLAICLGGVFFLVGGRTNILILGLDSREPDSDLGRSDTMILTTFFPRKPYLGMLSIPRDLWVNVPDYGEDRINSAHFYAEAETPGSGPEAAMQTVRQNFGMDVDNYLRVRFDGFLDLVDLLGGVEIELAQPMSGYPAGTHQLNGEQALAFVRDRAGSDDFFRMQRAQIFIKALWKELLDPAIWQQLPEILPLVMEMVDTNVPVTKWPLMAITLLRVGPEGIDARVITREMVHPFSTEGGAQVLRPNWEAINPVLFEMFHE